MTTGSGLKVLVEQTMAESSSAARSSASTQSSTTFFGGFLRLISLILNPFTFVQAIVSVADRIFNRTQQQQPANNFGNGGVKDITQASKVSLQEVKFSDEDCAVAYEIVDLIQKGMNVEALAKIDGFSDITKENWSGFCSAKKAKILSQKPWKLAQMQTIQMQILREFCCPMADRVISEKILDLLGKPEIDQEAILQLAALLSEEGNKRYEQFVEDDMGFYPSSFSEEQIVLIQLENFCLSELEHKNGSELLEGVPGVFVGGLARSARTHFAAHGRPLAGKAAQ